MSTGRVASPKLQVRISPGDKAVLEEISEITGSPVSVIVRQWVADRAMQYRLKVDDQDAAKMLDVFTKMMKLEMDRRGLTDEQAESVLSGRGLQPASETRASNTGSNRAQNETRHHFKGPAKPIFRKKRKAGKK